LLVVLFLALLVVAGFVGFRFINGRVLAQQAQQAGPGRFETLPARRGDLQAVVSATGEVRSAQSALLAWQTSGTVEAVSVNTGEAVIAGQVLASLEQTSLPPPLIIAGADFVEARRALDEVLQSQARQAQAQRAVEQAEQALEDALDPQSAQAAALKAVAQARKAAETAQRNLDILLSPASPKAVEAARATVLLWENAIKLTSQEIERINARLKNARAANMPGETLELYEAQLLSLAQNLVKYRRHFEDAQLRYQRLMQPPDPHDLAVAQANLELAQAQLAQAQREQERLEGGIDPSDIAVLQARLDDARRLDERLQGGPDPDEVATAQARLAAAQAALDMARLSAPFNGVVTAVDIRPGDMVSAGTQAFRLDDLSTLLVELQLSEIDVNRIQAGQPVSLAFDAVPGVAYTGEVMEAPAVGDLVDGLVSFRIKVAIRAADARVRPGMTASADIVVNELEGVLLVPAQAVRFSGGQRVVYVLREGRPVPVEVVLGLSSAEDIQVLEGDLQPGESVILNPPVQEGGG
jgi:HlyD family secretion protein